MHPSTRISIIFLYSSKYSSKISLMLDKSLFSINGTNLGVFIWYTSLSKLDPSLLTAAYDLGCDEKKAFLKVTLPLSVPGIISGITLVFLPAVSSFFIPKLLGGGSYVLVGNLIENYFVTTGDWNFGSAVSLIMAIIILISMYLTRKLDYDKENA